MCHGASKAKETLKMTIFCCFFSYIIYACFARSQSIRLCTKICERQAYLVQRFAFFTPFISSFTYCESLISSSYVDSLLRSSLCRHIIAGQLTMYAKLQGRSSFCIHGRNYCMRSPSGEWSRHENAKHCCLLLLQTVATLKLDDGEFGKFIPFNLSEHSIFGNFQFNWNRWTDSIWLNWIIS